MNYVIEVEHLAHSYGNRNIYEDLNFSLAPGKIYALLGKNGVGKTTLIQILMGFLRPVSGRCRVLGEDSYNLSPATRARIGLLFEGHLAYEFMSSIHPGKNHHGSQAGICCPVSLCRKLAVTEQRIYVSSAWYIQVDSSIGCFFSGHPPGGSGHRPGI